MLTRNKKGDLELDYIGKIIIGLIFLLILIYIVAIIIQGEFSQQGDKIKDIVFS